MNTVLICHSDSKLTRYGLSKWLSSFTQLQGIVLIEEDGVRTKQRVKAEIRRVGIARFLFDVVPYRIYSRIFHTRKNARWEDHKIRELSSRYKRVTDNIDVLVTNSPNSDAVKDLLLRLKPDMVIARCKTIIRKDIYSIPFDGTFIMHPGVCPEYKNAHGCFWALANNEPENVGMTLLKIDEGIDTGPIFGYYTYKFDVRNETPAIIHNRVLYDNLVPLKDKLMAIHSGKAEVINVSGRKSGLWGQPWLTKYFAIKYRCKY